MAKKQASNRKKPSKGLLTNEQLSELQNEIQKNPEVLKEILNLRDEIPNSKKGSLGIIRQQQRVMMNLPLPHPDILDGYDKRIKNGAERFMREFETQSEHRRELEKKQVEEPLKLNKQGQMFGFIIALMGLLLTGYTAYLGQDGVSGLLGVGTIGG